MHATMKTEMPTLKEQGVFPVFLSIYLPVSYATQLLNLKIYRHHICLVVSCFTCFVDEKIYDILTSTT